MLCFQSNNRGIRISITVCVLDTSSDDDNSEKGKPTTKGKTKSNFCEAFFSIATAFVDVTFYHWFVPIRIYSLFGKYLKERVNSLAVVVAFTAPSKLSTKHTHTLPFHPCFFRSRFLITIPFAGQTVLCEDFMIMKWKMFTLVFFYFFSTSFSFVPFCQSLCKLDCILYEGCLYSMFSTNISVR